MRRRAAAVLLCAVFLVFALPLVSSAAGAPSLAYRSNSDGTCTLTGIGSVSACEIVVPAVSPDGDSVTAIADRAFVGNTTLRRVSLPETISELGFGCFYGCTALVEIALPAGVAAVPDYAFCDCAALARVKLPEGITAIGENAFSGCRSLAAVSLPDSLLTIGAGAFSGCIGLSAVTVPQNVTGVAGEAFRGCTALESILFLSAGTMPALLETTLPEGAVVYAPEKSGAAQYCTKFARAFCRTDRSVLTAALTDATGAPGDEILLSLTVSENPGFNFLKIKIHYDKSVLSLVSCEPTAADGSVFQASRTTDVLPYVLVFASPGNRTGDGVVATLRFRIADGAPEGGYAVSVSAEQCFDESGAALPVLTGNSAVTVRKVLYGDVSDDGVIDGRDLTLLLEYLAGWKVTLNESFADVYTDGAINGLDVTLLSQYLADWDVVLGTADGAGD